MTIGVGRQTSYEGSEPPAMHPRAARIKLGEAKDYLALLEFARRAKQRLDGDTGALDELVIHARNMVEQYAAWANIRIDPRRRLPAKTFSEHDRRPEFRFFLDECGTHDLRPENDPFPVFCLCGIAVPADRYDTFDALWKDWKARWLGDSHARVHEPNVRHCSHRFYRADPAEQRELIESLNQQLAELEFTCIAAVIDKRRFVELYPSGKVDDFLPISTYLICTDFVFERFVHFLYHVGGDARGLTQAESRGLREDAEVHAEFLRLHLEGTQWQSEHQFRRALRPYIEFHRKDGKISGLEVADLVARPIAEKILRPDTTPARWAIIEPKIYDGLQGRKLSYGLKVFPAPEHDPISAAGHKTDGDAEAPPSADQHALVQ